jgi:4-aminobutyrate aminotransferase-like enzyme
VATRAPARLEPDRQRIRELARRELAALNERTRASEALFRRAGRVMPGGVASSFQLREPWPVYMTRGEGSRVWDADGNEYVDLHNGFGAMLQGHAHPAITAAVQARAAQGTHFGAPNEDAVVVAEELARRFRLPHWRFTNSGTESTMVAVRVARALTGRDPVVAIAGAYHGHHDTALATRKTTAGIPQATLDLVHEVPFNDAASMERRVAELAAEGRAPACVLMEPAKTHGGISPPAPGYLQAVRELTRRHGVLLIFDEVKTGLAIAAGGAVERYGVEPDVVTLAKALGAGLPSGAIGMSADAAGQGDVGGAAVGRDRDRRGTAAGRDRRAGGVRVDRYRRDVVREGIRDVRGGAVRSDRDRARDAADRDWRTGGVRRGRDRRDVVGDQVRDVAVAPSGVIAMPNGTSPTGMGVPAVPVAVSIGVTVSWLSLTA